MARKITEEQFIIRIKEHYPKEEFKVIEYTAASNFLKIQCCSCGKILEYPQAKNFLAKNKKAGCSECNGIKSKNTANLKKLLEHYDIIKTEKDKFSKTWYTCKCKICGRVSTHLLSSFLTNKCRCEGKGAHYTEEEFKQCLNKLYGTEYTLLTTFKNVNTKTLFKHSCGFIWSSTPAHILYNMTGCPKCCYKESKACKIIASELDRLNITYEKEKFLQNSLQRFDFYFENNNKKYAIEYNGKQHYEYMPFFHGSDIEVFKKYQERDKKKIEYCKNNNIHLIVIPYTFTNNEIRAYINNLFNSSTTIPNGSSFK